MDNDETTLDIHFAVLAVYQLGLIVWLFTDDMPRWMVALVVVLAILGWFAAYRTYSKEEES